MDSKWYKITDKNECLSLEVKLSDEGNKSLELALDDTKTANICVKLIASGLNTTYELYWYYFSFLTLQELYIWFKSICRDSL